MSSPSLRLLDLFAGAGGLSRGFHDASTRYRSVTAVEMDVPAAAAYRANFGSAEVVASDITSWLDEGGASPDMADVIIGGPPCQGFSMLGKRVVDDLRNDLWRQYVRAIVIVHPKYFVVENVAAFTRSPQFELFMGEVHGGALVDYDVEFEILNAADYGAPQARKRAIMIGRSRDLPAPGLPVPTHIGSHVSVGEALRRVPEAVDSVHLPDERSINFGGRTMAGAFQAAELHLGRQYTDLSMDRFRAIPPGGNRFDLPDALLARCWRGHTTGSGDVMGRLHLDRPSVTIRTEFFKPEKGRYIHPTADRAITHREAALLQGFPDTHRFVGSKADMARQIGNAVPIQLGAAIGRHLAAALK